MRGPRGQCDPAEWGGARWRQGEGPRSSERSGSGGRQVWPRSLLVRPEGLAASGKESAIPDGLARAGTLGSWGGSRRGGVKFCRKQKILEKVGCWSQL